MLCPCSYNRQVFPPTVSFELTLSNTRAAAISNARLVEVVYIVLVP